MSKRFVLDRVILFGELHLRNAIRSTRNHQGIANELIDAEPLSDAGEVVCRERLGGMLRFYHRAA